MFKGRTWWIVGASEGLGRALAEALDVRGARLILSARNGTRLDALAAELRDAVPMVMDVTRAEDVRQAAQAIGPIDGMIYCAGLYEPLTAQNWDAEAAEKICDVNYMGAVRVLGRIMPRFIEADRGRIVLIGSLAGFTGLPGAIGYGSSKAALMHLGENMQADLRGSGVSVQLVNPGFIETRLTAKNHFGMPQIQTPEAAAARCVQAIESGRFRTSFPAPFSWIFTLGRFLPRSLFLRLFQVKERPDAPGAA